MTRGLLWLPLLAVFIGLAWAGWNEYQKVEAYRAWAEQFDHAKYDLYAVLGQKGSELTWGLPTRQGPINLQTISLQAVEAIDLLVNDHVADLENPPTGGRHVALLLRLTGSDPPVRIRFTDLALAVQWGKHLQQDWQQVRA
jgi:hypothetical protein